MRVGVYIDEFNLYYGARQSCGKGTVGWRWLDVRSLVASRLPSHWADAKISRRLLHGPGQRHRRSQHPPG